MVRVKTKYFEFKMANPWMEIDDVPQAWIKAAKWVIKHPKKVKRWCKKIYKTVFRWDWVMPLFLGWVLGCTSAYGVWYYIVSVVYAA